MPTVGIVLGTVANKGELEVFSLRNVRFLGGDRQTCKGQDTKVTWGSAQGHMGAILEYGRRTGLLSTERIRKVPQLISL